MKGNQLEQFLNEWDLVLAGVAKKPDDTTLEVLFLRQVRTCSLMNDDVRDYDKLEQGSSEKSYEALKRCAARVIERKRLHTHQQQMQQQIAGGNALPGFPYDKEKGKGKGNKGAAENEDPLKGVCRLHLKGKCKAGASCAMKHNPPCTFFTKKGGCAKGNLCPFPHNRPAAAEAQPRVHAAVAIDVSGGGQPPVSVLPPVTAERGATSVTGTLSAHR